MESEIEEAIGRIRWTLRVLECLGVVQSLPVLYEAELCAAIARELERCGIPFEREVSLGDRRRIDFLCAGGVGIEVKKGSPNRAALVAQARRYCSSDRVSSMIRSNSWQTAESGRGPLLASRT